MIDVAEVAIKTSTRDQEKSPRGSCPNEHRWLVGASELRLLRRQRNSNIRFIGQES